MLGCFLPPSLPLRENDEPRVARTRIGGGGLNTLPGSNALLGQAWPSRRPATLITAPKVLSHFATVRVLVGTTHQPVHRYLAAVT
jgi:hypothetical protein